MSIDAGTEATTGYSRPDEYQPPAPSQQQQQQRQQQAALAAQQQQLAQAAMATRQSQVAATPTQPSPQNIRRNPLAVSVIQTEMFVGIYVRTCEVNTPIL